MPRPGPKFGIRLQLLGLFGLLMFTGAAVLALDEFERQRNQRALVQLKDESLAGLRRIKAVSDAYGLDIVDSTFRVRNGLIAWEEGEQVVDNARMRIREHWTALDAMPHTRQQRLLFEQIEHARIRADTAAQTLRGILAQRYFGQTLVSASAGVIAESWEALADQGRRRMFLKNAYALKAESPFGQNLQAYATVQGYREDGYDV